MYHVLPIVLLAFHSRTFVYSLKYTMTMQNNIYLLSPPYN